MSIIVFIITQIYFKNGKQKSNLRGLVKDKKMRMITAYTESFASLPSEPNQHVLYHPEPEAGGYLRKHLLGLFHRLHTNAFRCGKVQKITM